PRRAGPARWPASSSTASSSCARAPTTWPTTTRPACGASSTAMSSTAGSRPPAPSAPADRPLGRQALHQGAEGVPGRRRRVDPPVVALLHIEVDDGLDGGELRLQHVGGVVEPLG